VRVDSIAWEQIGDFPSSAASSLAGVRQPTSIIPCIMPVVEFGNSPRENGTQLGQLLMDT